MRNLVSYAEDILESFSALPFGPVDSLILSWVSYLRLPPVAAGAHTWQGMPLRELFRAEYFPQLFQGVWDRENSQRLLTALAASPRFRDTLVMGYTQQLDRDQEKQFAALSFQLTPDLAYAAFRGTDNSLVGWKEDFNMAFRYPVPSQEAALDYLTRAARVCTGRLRTGGHSKGGNLAVYAAANCPPAVRDRLDRVYSHDGPGFSQTVLQSEPFQRILPRVEKTLPQSSVVGLLLESQAAYRVVKSRRVSVLQHDPFSWEVVETDFAYLPQLAPDARYWDRTLDDWVRGLSDQERERFVEALFQVLSTNDIATFSQFKAGWQKNLPAVVHAAASLDPDTRTFFFRVLGELASISLRNFPELLRDHKPHIT